MWVVSKNHEVEKLKSCRPANPTSRECVFCFLTETLQSFIVVWKLHAAGFTVWEISEAANRMSHSGLIIRCTENICLHFCDTRAL